MLLDFLKLIEVALCYFHIWNQGIYFAFSLQFWEEKYSTLL